MKTNVKVSAIQMDIKGMDMEANLAHMSDLINKTVSEHHPELIVFPELANSGYVKAGDPVFSNEYIKCAEKIPGPFTEGLGEQARKYGVYIVAGMLEAHPQIPYTLYNSAVLIEPTGKIIGVHHKMHLPVVERPFFYPGNTLEVFETELGNIAIQVCADGSFPELSRIFALKGAEIICTTYNIPKQTGKDFLEERAHHVAVCRAMENLNFYIACNRVGSDAGGSFVGHSCIGGPWGQTLAYSSLDKEDILTAVLEEDEMVEARAHYSYFRERKPDLYSLLTAPL
ncbi:carbon-nitrogen hydrolase family protein [Chloroflexota bacterium]